MSDGGIPADVKLNGVLNSDGRDVCELLSKNCGSMFSFNFNSVDFSIEPNLRYGTVV